MQLRCLCRAYVRQQTGFDPTGDRCFGKNQNDAVCILQGLTRISHQDHGRRTEPAGLTRWTSPHLIFESTKYFAQSAIHAVIPLLRKILCESKSRRDHLVPW